MEKNWIQWIITILEEYGRNFITGTFVTLEIAILGTVLGFLLGFALGIIRSTPISSEDGFIKRFFYWIFKAISTAYVQIFRCTPMMVQAMVLFYGFSTLGVKIPPFTAAVLVTLLNTGSYMAESVRGGIAAIDPGQFEGGKAMGMSHFQIMLHVILPQTFRNLIPEMGNQLITNLKMTSVLNVIGVGELYFATKTAANVYYRYFEAYLITGLVYFVLCYVASKLLGLLEKKMQGKADYELAVEYLPD